MTESATKESLAGLSIDDKFTVLKSMIGADRKAAEMTDSGLADDIVMLRKFKKLVENREKLLSTIVKGRHEQSFKEACLGEDDIYTIKGVTTQGLRLKEVTQTRLDSDKIREDESEEWIEEHSKTITFLQLDVLKED